MAIPVIGRAGLRDMSCLFPQTPFRVTPVGCGWESPSSLVCLLKGLALDAKSRQHALSAKASSRAGSISYGFDKKSCRREHGTWCWLAHQSIHFSWYKIRRVAPIAAHREG